MVIAPWQRGELHPEDEQRLAAVLDQIAALDLREPVWLHPEFQAIRIVTARAFLSRMEASA
jgi:hypothetical protein